MRARHVAAYITLSATGRLGAMQWAEPGLKLNFMV